MDWPANSTAGELLKRKGLVKKRRRRRPVPADNQSWGADFKGDFKLGNKQRCYPLTITDNCSRYLLARRGLNRTRYEDTRLWFEYTLREFGLPQSIRTDNGSPFASRSLGGLSRLSKWWIDLGVRVERIRPGRPQENGRHERMHRSLKAAACKESAYGMERQQERFDKFRHEYNELRSHESLNRRTSERLYEPSQRRYPELILPPQYDCDMTVRTFATMGKLYGKINGFMSVNF
ncbi:MAG: integrase core domain-containing protein [Desulfuromonadales bacterium]|nr:integrase core domain-containing protein [Desulfuromonadales bacterium]